MCVHVPQVNPFTAHKVEPPSTTVTATKDELIKYFREMYLIRRMEISADMLYKVPGLGGSKAAARSLHWV